MIIVFISFLAVAGLLCWALCASIPPDHKDNEEQIQYLKEWREKHK